MLGLARVACMADATTTVTTMTATVTEALMIAMLTSEKLSPAQKRARLNEQLAVLDEAGEACKTSVHAAILKECNSFLLHCA
eukprot:6110627-Amphidinium_carterae.1